MRKRMLLTLILLALCLFLADCASVDANADTDTDPMPADAADAALISEKMGIPYADAREIYELLRGLGMSEGVKYVTAWTEPVSGEKYFRIRTSDGFFDYYPDSGIVKDSDESVVYGAELGADTSSDAADTETDGGEAFTVILNTNTKKYHYPGCRSIDSMKESNREEITVRSPSELFSRGYLPCSVCAWGDLSEAEE